MSVKIGIVEKYASNTTYCGPQKINKCALKLIGVKYTDLSDEDLLESISIYIIPSKIKALFFDQFLNFYILFLSDIESTCRLAGKSIQAGAFKMHCLPLLECYIVNNVYPSIRDEELRHCFSTFGIVFEISQDLVLPNSSKFSHVLSGKREISFLLKGDESELAIPINVFKPPYKLHVVKLCNACLTEGHSLLNCPDRDDEELSLFFQKSKCEFQAEVESDVESNVESDVESYDSLTAVIKAEEIPELPSPEHIKLESFELSGRSLTNRYRTANTVWNDDSSSEPNAGMNSDNLDSDSSEDSTKKKRRLSTDDHRLSAYELSSISKRTSTVVSSSELSIFDIETAAAKKVNLEFSDQANECICMVKGVLPAEGVKLLMQSDARNKNELATLVYTYTNDMNDVLRQLNQILTKSIPTMTSGESRFKRKLLTLISVLGKFTS